MSPRIRPVLLLALALAACAPHVPTPPAGPSGAPATRAPAKAPPAQAGKPPELASVAPSRVPAPPPLSGIVVPPEALYVCVTEQDGKQGVAVIEFAPKVLALCRNHPEMGPCQYERNACRAGGGRVLAAGGQEVTLATEAEYDKKVRRVRFGAK